MAGKVLGRDIARDATMVLGRAAHQITVVSL